MYPPLVLEAIRRGKSVCLISVIKVAVIVNVHALYYLLYVLGMNIAQA